MNNKEQKLMQEAMDLHYNCDEQHDCVHCLFGKGGIPCKVSRIHSEWFKDELVPEGVDHLRDATETICTATVTRTYKPVTRGEILDMAKKIVTLKPEYKKVPANSERIGCYVKEALAEADHLGIQPDEINVRLCETDGGEISLYGTDKNGRRVIITYNVLGEKTPVMLR